MTLNEYQKAALVTALRSNDELKDLAHWVLGVTGEAGEIAEKVKKVIRDKDGKLSAEDRPELLKEIGDVMWYLAVLANHLGSDLETIGQQNIAKLQSRQKRNMLTGSGDNR